MSLRKKISNWICKHQATVYLYRGMKMLLTKGPAPALRRTRQIAEKAYDQYKHNPYRMTEKEIQAQKNRVFREAIQFSILVPLYNTPEQYLKEMIESVLYQTYENWELCLADASDEAHEYVGVVCREYAERCPKIRYQKLKENKGISDNTNAAIEMASGDYISLLDHDDLLQRGALYHNMIAITEQQADFIYTDELTFSKSPFKSLVTHYKPDFAIDNLRANNYICHFTSFKRSLLDEAGWFSNECDGSQDYDIILRLTEKAKRIVHIPKVLYFWRSHPGSVASDISVKPYCLESAKRALNHHLKRVGLKGEAIDAPNVVSIYRIRYQLQEKPFVSIVIPNKNHLKELKTCIDSILQKTTYSNYEILIVENGSTEQDIFDYYQQLQQKDFIRILTWKQAFNYAAINNFAVEQAAGSYLLFLNNDVEIISENWIEEMLMFAQRSDVGAVGAKLYFPNDTIQHAGIVLGLGGVAGHFHYGMPREYVGYMGRLCYSQNYSAVTAACMMVSAEKFHSVNGFDEHFEVSFNDVDFCLKLRERGFVNVFTPYAELYHYESMSRGSDKKGENKVRFDREVALFQKKWKKVLEAGDPYLNPDWKL